MSSSDPSDISRILHTANRNNFHHGITSVLIFDGITFCQYLEGTELQLDSLLQRISTDARHTQLTICERSAIDGRRFPNWHIVFALTLNNEALACFTDNDGESAFAKFERLLPTLDLGPVNAI